MSTFKTPVGPQPNSVYWRRRLLLLLGLVAIVAIIVLIIVKPGSSPETATPGNTKTPVAETPTGEAGEAGACAKDDVEVTAITDKGAYDAGVAPMISLSIENTSDVACTFQVGPDVQNYVITTGDETVWRSADCAAESEPVEISLEPGKPMTTTPIEWDRTKSAKDTCDGERPSVTAGGASYHLSAVVDGVESAKTKQFLLN